MIDHPSQRASSPFHTRRATAGDLPSIARIQAAAPEASQWEAASYLDHDCRVATRGAKVVGFIILREIAPLEQEILNLVVEPNHRRNGVAKLLIHRSLSGSKGVLYLEVRESNQAARKLYETIGFCQVGRREKYYTQPIEAAIVMRFQSC